MSADTESTTLYKVPEVAAKVRVHYNTVRAAVARGELECFRIGPRGLIRCNDQQIKEWLESRTAR